jgi:putative solute:sodium symporter small subunit
MDTKEKSNQLEHESALNNQALYWQANLKLLAKLLVVWFAVSFGCGIILVDWLDQFTIAGFKLGFWFAQQGAIYVFVALIFVYARQMKILDRQFDVGDDNSDQEPQS